MFGKVTKTEWCLLGLTGIFLCGLLALSQHDRREMEDGGVETDLARILEYRETHGPFAAVEELMEVSGIGEAKLAALEGRVTVNGE